MRNWSERLEKAMEKSETVRAYVQSEWADLYHYIDVYGPAACIDDQALDAMVDAEEHDIRVFSL